MVRFVIILKCSEYEDFIVMCYGYFYFDGFEVFI